MTTDRPYRLALDLPAAVEELRANSGTQFDPVVVEALIEIVARWDRPNWTIDADSGVLAPVP